MVQNRPKTDRSLVLYMPAELKESIHNIAHDQRISMNELIRRVMSEYVGGKNEA